MQKKACLITQERTLQWVGSHAIFLFIQREDKSPLGELARATFLTEYVQQILDDDIYVHQNLGGDC
jgi:hypothetical protein